MAFVRSKMINGYGPYYYLVKTERVNGKSKQVHIAYLGKNPKQKSGSATSETLKMVDDKQYAFLEGGKKNPKHDVEPNTKLGKKNLDIIANRDYGKSYNNLDRTKQGEIWTKAQYEALHTKKVPKQPKLSQTEKDYLKSHPITKEEKDYLNIALATNGGNPTEKQVIFNLALDQRAYTPKQAQELFDRAVSAGYIKEPNTKGIVKPSGKDKEQLKTIRAIRKDVIKAEKEEKRVEEQKAIKDADDEKRWAIDEVTMGTFESIEEAIKDVQVERSYDVGKPSIRAHLEQDAREKEELAKVHGTRNPVMVKKHQKRK